MGKTVSGRIGGGSTGHNSREYSTNNVDPSRTHLNIDYCNEPIKDAFHKLFDDALERYNAKQTRDDRKIADYYEKISSGKQEKPFYEIIMQIGNMDDTGATTVSGEQAKVILDEYFQGFRERNPNLYVFSAHLHMDEATPHLHIDFIPYITGSTRGLDTRVSLKKALAAQGFEGEGRSNTEWNQWMASEKIALSQAMKRHGIEWEHKGTHEEHLSIIEYKKKERTEELEAVNAELAEKKVDLRTAADRVNNLKTAETAYKDLKEKLAYDPEYLLPEPSSPLMLARTYKEEVARPLVKKLKSIIKSLFVQYHKVRDNLIRVTGERDKLLQENNRLSDENGSLTRENAILKEQNKGFRRLQKNFGPQKLEEMLNQTKAPRQREHQEKQANIA